MAQKVHLGGEHPVVIDQWFTDAGREAVYGRSDDGGKILLHPPQVPNPAIITSGGGFFYEDMSPVTSLDRASHVPAPFRPVLEAWIKQGASRPPVYAPEPQTRRGAYEPLDPYGTEDEPPPTPARARARQRPAPPRPAAPPPDYDPDPSGEIFRQHAAAHGGPER
jgi:hypothetical protein